MKRIENLPFRAGRRSDLVLIYYVALSTPFYNLPYLGQRGEAA
jgi:hypothetical protein